MSRPLIAAACALALAACGGSDTSNAAASATFHYGSPSAASASMTGALAGPLASSSAFAATPSAEQGLGLSDPSALTAALLGASGYGVDVAAAAPSLQPDAIALGVSRGLTGGSFDASCASVSAASVTYSNCSVTVDDTSGTTTFHAVVTINGSVSYTASKRTLAWDLRVGESISVSGSTPVNGGGAFHLSGSLAVTDTTLVGHMASELDLNASGGGQSLTIGVDESVDVNVSYASAATCSSRVTEGTLEAKRVWTARPSGATASDLPDGAAKVTWTACGTATLQLGTR